MTRKTCAVILASGKGERMGFDFPKQFAEICQRTMIERSIDAFEKNPLVDEITIVIEPSSEERLKELLKSNDYSKITNIIHGGATRMESARKGIGQIKESDAKILIHDAARPLVSQRIINDCISALDSFDAVNTAIKATDTIIRAKNGIMSETTDRNSMMQVQTPQGFRAETIKEAHKKAEEDGFCAATDDCGIVFRYGLADIHIIEGERTNIKITYPEDIVLAEKFIAFCGRKAE